MCVGHLLGVPQARGLAGRAISQSGGLRLPLDRDQAARVASAVAAQLGVAPLLQVRDGELVADDPPNAWRNYPLNEAAATVASFPFLAPA